MAYSKIFIHSSSQLLSSTTTNLTELPSLHSFICPNLVLVVGIAVAEVSYEPDEVCLKADDRRIRRRVSISTEGGEVLSSTENILTGLPSGVYLLQELCMDRQFVADNGKSRTPSEKQHKAIQIMADVDI